MGEYQGGKVAVKVLRIYTTSNLDKITSVGHSLKLPNGVYQADDCDLVEVLQGGNDVEKSSPSERAPTVGSDNAWQTFCNGVRMDGQREYQ